MVLPNSATEHHHQRSAGWACGQTAPAELLWGSLGGRHHREPLLQVGVVVGTGEPGTTGDDRRQVPSECGQMRTNGGVFFSGKNTPKTRLIFQACLGFQEHRRKSILKYSNSSL